MTSLKLGALLALLGLPTEVLAGGYVSQNSFPLPLASLNAIDSDSVGNLYVLGLANGSGTYSVSEYQTPGMTPLLSFNAGVSSPAAFAVEGSGVVDVLDGSGAPGSIVLKRFQNNGAFLGQASYSIASPYYSVQLLSSAIDKANGRVYLTYQQWVSYFCLQCLGCSCPPSGNKGFINQYDFQGNLLKSITMPGISATAGSCYTPSKLTTDPQGNLYVADASCNHLLKYSLAGALVSDTPASDWSSWFSPRALWTDSSSNLYINQLFCGATGCPQSVVKFSPSLSLQTSFAVDAPVGCAWDSRILYLSSSNGASLQRFIFDNPPSVPTETAPLNPIAQHSSYAGLNWQASNDPDGDPVTYSVYLGPGPNQLSAIGSTNQTSLASPSLSFGTTYYWQVVAQDAYQGIPILQQPAPVVSFNMSFTDNPPEPFGVVRGAGTVVTRNTSVSLAWQTSQDPDGDLVVYDLYWRPASQTTASLAVSTPATSWTMTGLGFGATYYWSVKARDPYGATTAMSGGAEQAYYPVFQNSPPPAPSVLSGTGPVGEHTFTPSANLSWSGVTDPDGDPVGYRLYLGTSPSSTALVQDGSQTSYTLSNALFGATYYWQVSAYDPYGGASTTAVQALSIYLQNSPPNPFSVLTGTGTSATRNTSQLFSWQMTGDPDGDPVQYTLYLSTLATRLNGVYNGAASSFTTSGLVFGATYYWSVVAQDNFGAMTPNSGGVQSFLPIFQNDPPTVPVNLSKTGTILYHGYSPSQSFFWQNSTDSEGDPFTYNLYFGTDANHLALTTSVPLGYTISNLSVNVGYYYQIVATDIYGASSPSPINWVYFQFTDNPPGSFNVLSGTGTWTTRNNNLSLSWIASVDPDGDLVTYRVYLGTAPFTLAPIADTTQTSSALSSLGFGTTYYWRVDAYDGFGATTTINGGTQSLFLVFDNPPPSPIVYLSTATSYSLHVTSPMVNLSWAASTDSYGDPISYRLDVQMSTGAWPSVQLGTATSVSFSPVFETTYSWRIEAQNPYGGASTGAWMSFIVHLTNRPPYSILYTSTNTLITRATSYALAWQDTGDPDGDPTTYGVFLGTSPASLALAQQGTQTTYPLAFQYGTTYYWQVSATDNFGAQTAGPIQTFLAVFRNIAPPVPAITGGTGILQEHTLSPSATLSWSTVADPDGDPTTYQVHIGTSPQALYEVQKGTLSAYSLAGPLFNTTYYWQISVSNPYGAASTTAVQSLLIFLQNSPPGPFSVQSGTGTLRTRATSQLLSWGTANDPDGDPLAYELRLSTNASSQALVQLSSTTSYLLQLQYGTTYYWRVDAYDGFGATTTINGGLQSLFSTFLSDPPGPLSLAAPFMGTPMISTMQNQVVVTWNQVTTPERDAVGYTVYLGDSPSTMQTLTTISANPQAAGPARLTSRPAALWPSSQVQIGGNTIQLTLARLSFYHTYYLQIVASNPYGATSQTQVQSFTLTPLSGFPKAYNYPNPFNPNRGGTHIVFNAPPSGYARAKVSIYSELQDLLFERDYDNIVPGISQVDFNGRDRYGRALYNGSYIGRVRFQGPDDQATFYLMVVK